MIYFKTPISSKNSLPAKDNSRSFQIKNTFEIYMPGSLIGRITVFMKLTTSFKKLSCFFIMKLRTSFTKISCLRNMKVTASFTKKICSNFMKLRITFSYSCSIKHNKTKKH